MTTRKITPLPGASVSVQEDGTMLFEHWMIEDESADEATFVSRATAILDWLLQQAQSGARHVFDVRDYGAKGDGVADDAQAIQRAVDASARYK